LRSPYLLGERLLHKNQFTLESPNGEEVIRIISAREADPRERRSYLEQAP
jgi:uncharacterized DUF497 family protein